MVEEISGSAAGWLNRVLRSGKARTEKTDGPADGEHSDGDQTDLSVSAELRTLLDRIKSAETMRKGVVHAVLEKFGGDSLKEIQTRVTAWRKHTKKLMRG